VTEYLRSWALDDIQISRSYGDKRTVEAYAAVFDIPAEISDRHGHYMEVIDRSAFKRTLLHGIDRVGVYYNHAMNAHGQPSDMYSVPIGVPVEIKPDGKGLRTVTRYNAGPDADRILEAIRNDAIRGYSFRGRIYKSTPGGRVRPGKDGQLPTILRTELGLTEYGPTPSPAYEHASILAIRSAAQLADDFAGLDEAQRAELIRILASTTPVRDSETPTATPIPGPGAEDPPERHSGRLRALQLELGKVLNGVHD